MIAIDHSEREIMQILQDMTNNVDQHHLQYLNEKRSELAERLAMAHLAYGKELEADKDYDGAIDTYGKAVKALENADSPNELLVNKISKARGLALTKRVETMANMRDIEKRRGLNTSDMEFHDDLGREMNRARERNYKIKSRDQKRVEEIANGRQLKVAKTVSLNHSKVFRPLDTPQHLTDPTGRFVIKKNNFMVNTSKGVNATSSKSKDLEAEQSSSQTREQFLLDTFDIADANIDQGAMGDIYPPSSTPKELKSRATSGGHQRKLFASSPVTQAATNGQNRDFNLDKSLMPQPLKSKQTLQLRANHGPFQDPADTYPDTESLMHGVVTRERVDMFAEKIKLIQPRMYKVAGRHSNLPVSIDEAAIVIQNQKGIPVRPLISHLEGGEPSNVKEEVQEKLKEERMSFLTHLMTGKPMEIKKPIFNKDREGKIKSNEDGIKFNPQMNTTSKGGDALKSQVQHSEIVKDQGYISDPSENLEKPSEEAETVRLVGFFNKLKEHADKLRENDAAATGKKAIQEDDDDERESQVSGADRGIEVHSE